MKEWTKGNILSFKKHNIVNIEETHFVKVLHDTSKQKYSALRFTGWLFDDITASRLSEMWS